MRLQKHAGLLLVVLSAVIFGFTPSLGKLTYLGGSNALMMTFLRALFALPVLGLVLLVRRVPMRLSGTELKKVIVLGSLGSALTGCTLYGSFNYIPVGMGTAVHFAYPALVLLLSIVMFRERVTKVKILVLVLTVAGVALTCDLAAGGSLRGVALALASAVSYAFMMLYQYHSGLVLMEPFKLCFYQCSVISVCMLIVSLLSGRFTLALTPAAWAYSAVVALLVSVVGLTALQRGLKQIGSSDASFLSTVEPLTSILCGWLLLGEVLAVRKLIGCCLILVGVVFLSVFRATAEPVEEPGD